MADRLFEGEEAVLHVMGWVGHPHPGGRFVDGPALCGHLPANVAIGRSTLDISAIVLSLHNP